MRLITIMVLSCALYACGTVHHRVAAPPQNVSAVKQVKLLPVEVSSKENNPDALALNEQWKKIASNELQALLDVKKITVTDSGEATVGCFIDVVYGSRAMRYLVGFGAGAGHMNVALELKDKQGAVLYATDSKADLGAGAFGGDMSEVARNTIEEAVKKFGAGL